MVATQSTHFRTWVRKSDSFRMFLTISSALFLLFLAYFLTPKELVIQSSRTVSVQKESFLGSVRNTQQSFLKQRPGTYSPLMTDVSLDFRVRSLPINQLSFFSTNESSLHGVSLVLGSDGRLSVEIRSSAYPSGQKQQVLAIEEIRPNETYSLTLKIDRGRATYWLKTRRSTMGIEEINKGDLRDPYNVDLSPQNVLLGSEEFGASGGRVERFSASFRYTELVRSLNSFKALLVLISMFLFATTAYTSMKRYRERSGS